MAEPTQPWPWPWPQGPGRNCAALRWNRRIHDGSDMGLIRRIIITLAGLIPAGLAVTSVIVWARRRLGKARDRGHAA